MNIIELNYNELKNYNTDSLILGLFDGVHLGHQELIKRAKEISKDISLLTFSNNFKQLLSNKIEYQITSLSDKADYLSELGINNLFIINVDKQFLNISKDDFISFLKNRLNPNVVICGEDYTFGNNKEGTASYLKDHIPTIIVPFILDNNEKISSRNIKELISIGEIENANRLLNHPYRVSGLVVEGKRNGRKIELPTANLDLDFNYVLPKEGVYITKTIVDFESFLSITSVSKHPTIEELNKPIIETHILDYNHNIYGKFIFVEFLKYIRPIYKFKDLDELKKQITKDEKDAKRYLQQ
ncbi:MAG: bifunctional riboflavin kinase/FAD synthetase [Bacilli bacterium]